jgi:hypothetical protein
VILALVVCFFVRVAWEGAMTHLVLQPFAIEQQQQPDAANGSLSPMYMYYGGQVDMFVYSKTFLDGKEISQDQANNWYENNMVCVPMEAPTPGATPSAGASGSPGDTSSPGASATPDDSKFGNGSSGIACQGPNIDPSHQPQYVQYVIPGAWYWRVVGLESVILFLGSLFLGAIAFVWVDRRRPY